MSPEFSFIVPFYKVDKDYLENCIDSILGQDFEDLEIIAVNDGSPEVELKELCLSKQKSDSRFIYLEQENSGVSVARNNGLEHAKGKYVLFVDADDYVSEGMLRQIHDYLADKSDIDMLVFGYCTNYTNREMRRVLDSPDMSVFDHAALQLAVLQGDKRLGPVEVGTPWSKVIKRSIIEDNRVRYTKGLRKGQDTVFILNLLEYCKSIDYLPIAGYHYRMSAASISHRFNPQIVEIMEETLKAYERFVADNNKSDEYKNALSGKYYRILLAEYCDLYFMNKNNPKSSSDLKRELSELIAREPYASSIKKSSEQKLSFLTALEVFLLKNKWFSLLWHEKAMLNIAKGVIIKNYN